jgi:hypothetical protein
MPIDRRFGRSLDDRECRVDLSGRLRDLPAIDPAEQVDVSHERPVMAPIPLNRVTPSSPEAAIATSKPPSVRASSIKL